MTPATDESIQAFFDTYAAASLRAHVKRTTEAAPPLLVDFGESGRASWLGLLRAGRACLRLPRPWASSPSDST